jgi:hypothetical protein
MAQRSWRQAGALVLTVVVTTAVARGAAGTETVAGRSGVAEADRRESGDGVSIASGDRVRVFAKGLDEPLIGTVISLEDDALVIASKNEKVTHRISWNAIEDLRRSRGRRTHAEKGLLVGASIVGIPVAVLSGALAGACWDLATSEHGRECGGIDAGAATTGLIAGAAVGGIIGAAIGSLPREPWDKVPLRKPQVRIGLSPERGGASASVVFSF